MDHKDDPWSGIEDDMLGCEIAAIITDARVDRQYRRSATLEITGELFVNGRRYHFARAVNVRLKALPPCQ